MDEKLKGAIAAARIGDKETAQRQLTELLDEDPQQVQGWYLLSLLVDSPQKQAAYLSKTLALNPDHEKAKEQLAALQAADTLAPITALAEETSQPRDVLAQSETDELPDWLREVGDAETGTAVPAPSPEETAVPNVDLPDWLKEPVALPEVASPPNAVADSSAVEGKTAETGTKVNKVTADRKKTLDKPQKKQPKAARTARQGARNLNMLLGFLVTLAAIVLILLAYLLLS